MRNFKYISPYSEHASKNMLTRIFVILFLFCPSLNKKQEENDKNMR